MTHWHLAPLKAQRHASLETLITGVRSACPAAEVSAYSDVQTAYNQAMALADEGDRVLVFGSFYTVAQTCADGL